MGNLSDEICERLAQLRHRHFGPRGKARFARLLGIRASSYQHYEFDRTPPAELLVRAAELTETRVEWLLTGQGDMSTIATDGPESSRPERTAAGPSPELLQRLRDLLDERPALGRSVSGFFDLLEGVAHTFPADEVANDSANNSAQADVGQTDIAQANVRKTGEGLIPVVGGTAAGLARYWEELDDAQTGTTVDARLESLLAADAQRTTREARLVSPQPVDGDERLAALVQFSEPDELGFIEFLDCPGVKARYPHAVAWRIDGDSMTPRYRDGDLVITSRLHPATEGQPAVARQQGQIGVNCKLFRRDGDDVLLIPINESAVIQRIPANELLWAYRVLYSVKLSTQT